MEIPYNPFHSGELAIQGKLEVKELVAGFAPYVIRTQMPDQHREFYAELPYFLMGSIGEDGLPWASILWGEPGFVASPSPTELTIATLPDRADPLHANMRSGQEIGMVGVQFHTRRRNRVNGRIHSVSNGGFSITVTQSFGNCPKYIQGREINGYAKWADISSASTASDKLSVVDAQLIGNADTLFIASASSKLGADERHGVDMSHRGGAPGFVKILDDGSLLIPDFTGNNMYNTLGNIHANPLAGLLFFDFESGDLLQLTGIAKIVWPEDTEFTYSGALRYIQITPSKVARRGAAMPYKWGATAASPYLPEAAKWRKAVPTSTSVATGKSQYRVADIVTEATGIKSFYLQPVEGGPVPDHTPGQHLPIAVNVNGKQHRRTYTLSAAPSAQVLRLTIKRGGGGTVSKHMHDGISVGDTVTAQAPAGKFVLKETADVPVVLISAGVGITPMIAMAEVLLAEQLPNKQIHFIHGARAACNVPFLNQLRRWPLNHKNTALQLRYSRAATADTDKQPFASCGRIDSPWLTSLKLPKSADYYLCGPPGFMQTVYDHLITSGTLDDQIHFETFGPASLKRVGQTVQRKHAKAHVTFKKSGIEAVWHPSNESLLELAEKNGIEAPFSCRSGSCGSCAAPLLKGTVGYDMPPDYCPKDNELLLCCAAPKPGKRNRELIINL